VKCTSCDDGYHAEGLQCIENQCTCEHGVAANGTDCPTHGDAKCVSCDSGYHVDDGMCSNLIGTCYDSTGARPLNQGATTVTTVQACVDFAQDFTYMATGCPNEGGFECWRGNSIDSRAVAIDMRDYTGTPTINIGNGMSNGHCHGFESRYTMEYNGYTVPLGGWHREPVIRVTDLLQPPMTSTAKSCYEHMQRGMYSLFLRKFSEQFV
jgi:hypothetical protein